MANPGPGLASTVPGTSEPLAQSFNPAVPGPIGATTPASGNFTALGVGAPNDGVSGDIVASKIDGPSGSLTIGSNATVVSFGLSEVVGAQSISIDNFNLNPPGTLQLNAQGFGTLPAASAALVGAMACVNDSTTQVFGATITGGGGFTVLAFCNGAHWTVCAI